MGDGTLDGGGRTSEKCKWSKKKKGDAMQRRRENIRCPTSVPHLFSHSSQFLFPLPSTPSVAPPSHLIIAAPPPPLQLPPPSTLYPFLTSSGSCPPFPSPSASPPRRLRLQPSARVPPMLSLIRWRRDKAAISPCQRFDMTL